MLPDDLGPSAKIVIKHWKTEVQVRSGIGQIELIKKSSEI